MLTRTEIRKPPTIGHDCLLASKKKWLFPCWQKQVQYHFVREWPPIDPSSPSIHPEASTGIYMCIKVQPNQLNCSTCWLIIIRTSTRDKLQSPTYSHRKRRRLHSSKIPSHNHSWLSRTPAPSLTSLTDWHAYQQTVAVSF